MNALVAAAVAAIVARWWRARRRAAALAERRRAAVPELIDVLVILVRSGLSPALAFRRLEGLSPLPLRGAVAAVVGALDGGARFADALDHLRDPATPAMTMLADVLAHAERHGEPVARALDRLAAEARGERRRLADADARRLPVRLCFPLVCCTLPAFVVLAIVPLLAGTLSSYQRLTP